MATRKTSPGPSLALHGLGATINGEIMNVNGGLFFADRLVSLV